MATTCTASRPECLMVGSGYLSTCPKVCRQSHPLGTQNLCIARGLLPLHTQSEQFIRRMLVTKPAKRQSLIKVLAHKWMVADGKSGAGVGDGEPRKEQERRLQVYDENSGAVRWCEPVLTAVQQMGLDVNEVKRVSRSMEQTGRGESNGVRKNPLS